MREDRQPYPETRVDYINHNRPSPREGKVPHVNPSRKNRPRRHRDGVSVNDLMREKGFIEKEEKVRKGPKYYILGLIQDFCLFFFIFGVMFILYLYFWKPYYNDQQRLEQNQKLEETISQQEVIPNEDPGVAGFVSKPLEGQLFGQIRIPALGPNWKYSITSGTELEDIKYGPGWYTNTQLPGERGNFAIAGHNGPGGAFTPIDTLKTCDDIFVTTAGGTWNYKVSPLSNTPEEWEKFRNCAPNATSVLDREMYKDMYGQSIISPHDVQVLNPVPMSDSVYIPENALPVITMQSCWPPNGNSKRLIVHGVLESSTGNKLGD